MFILGIESTAHTFGVGIVTDEGKILANERDIYTTKQGGIHPVSATNHHVDVCDVVLRKSLETAKLTLKDVDVVVFSQSPGLGACLRIGAFIARQLSVKLNKPLVGVNHCIAHLEIGRLLTPAKDPVLLYASGANTQVIGFEGGKYRVFGETLDIGVGNFLDTFARELGIGFPGGPKIEALARDGKKYVDLPYVVKGMDVSFGGMLTFLKNNKDKFVHEDLAFSAQETVFAMLVEVAERAMAHTGKNELVLGGGVACNARLQEMARKMCEERGAQCFVPERQFLVDNGAMIAWLGFLQWEKNRQGSSLEESRIEPYLRTDDVVVTWR